MRKLFWIGGSVIGMALIVAGVWWGSHTLLASPVRHVPQTIARLSDCVGKTITCYDEYLRARTINDSPEVAIGEVKQAYMTDAFVKAQCHEIMHSIGAAALERYGNMYDVMKHSDSFCQFGYVHGAEEALRVKHG